MIAGTFIVFSRSEEVSLLNVILLILALAEWELSSGLCLYVLILPFVILGFASPFFRKRLCGCLNLKTPADVPLFHADNFDDL